jgi:hypothetical protein
VRTDEAEEGLLYVEPEIFAEGGFHDSETRLLDDGGRPYPIPIDDFEGGLREVIVSDWLPRVEQVLLGEGVDLSGRDLERMLFVVELTADLRRHLAEKREAIAGEESRRDAGQNPNILPSQFRMSRAR